MMATAARVTIAEVEQLVEPGEIDPDAGRTRPASSCSASSRAIELREAHREADGAVDG